MTETRELICINCPLGCGLTVTLKDGDVVKVEGNNLSQGRGLWKEGSDRPYQDRNFYSKSFRRGSACSLCKDSLRYSKRKDHGLCQCFKECEDPGAGVHRRRGCRRRVRHGSFCHSHEEYLCRLNQMHGQAVEQIMTVRRDYAGYNGEKQ